MDDFRDSKAQLKYLAELEDPNYVEDENLIYPCLQAIEVVKLFGKNSVTDRTLVYNREQF